MLEMIFSVVTGSGSWLVEQEEPARPLPSDLRSSGSLDLLASSLSSWRKRRRLLSGFAGGEVKLLSAALTPHVQGY